MPRATNIFSFSNNNSFILERSSGSNIKKITLFRHFTLNVTVIDEKLKIVTVYKANTHTHTFV